MLRILMITILSIITILTSLLSLFFDDIFFSTGYQANNVYDDVGYEKTWTVTKEFREFLLGSELHSFSGNEYDHLVDVKNLFLLGQDILIGCLLIFFLLLLLSKGIKDLIFVLKKTSKVVTSYIVILILLGLNWNWFFNKFHEILFTGNWTFSYDTLTIQLWGGTFFPIAAAFFIGKALLLGGFFYVGSRYLEELI